MTKLEELKKDFLACQKVSETAEDAFHTASDYVYFARDAARDAAYATEAARDAYEAELKKQENNI